MMHTNALLKKQVKDRLSVYHNGVIFLHNPIVPAVVGSSDFSKLQSEIEIPLYVDSDIDLDYMINKFLVKNITDFYCDYYVACNLNISALMIPDALKNDYKSILVNKSYNWDKSVLIMGHYCKRFIGDSFLIGSSSFWKVRYSNPVDNFPTMILAYDFDSMFWDVNLETEDDTPYLDATVYLRKDAAPFILEFLYPENIKTKK